MIVLFWKAVSQYYLFFVFIIITHSQESYCNAPVRDFNFEEVTLPSYYMLNLRQATFLRIKKGNRCRCFIYDIVILSFFPSSFPLSASHLPISLLSPGTNSSCCSNLAAPSAHASSPSSLLSADESVNDCVLLFIYSPLVVHLLMDHVCLDFLPVLQYYCIFVSPSRLIHPCFIFPSPIVFSL